MRTTIPILALCAVATMVSRPVPLRAQRRPVTAAEIERLPASAATAYDVVRALRSQWLRSREAMLTQQPTAPVQEAPVRVYLDGRDQGDVEYLKTIPAERIAEMHWISATEAGARYGPTNGPGIVVILKQ